MAVGMLPRRPAKTRGHLPPSKRVSYPRLMTICVAAFAEDSKAIICIADRSVSYGDDITGESDAAKIIRLPSGVVALVSGGEAEFERVIRKLARNPKLGVSLLDTVTYAEKCYQEAREELIAIRYLKPNLIDDPKVLRDAAMAPEANKYVRELASTVASFDMGCWILLCGFDEQGTGFILRLENPGQAMDVTRVGYDAIGSGWIHAIARLVWNEWTRKKPVDEALFYTLDAKISAEVNPFISGEWDASIMFAGEHNEVPKDIRGILDKAWVLYDRSPYWKREPDDWDAPPRNWKKLLCEYAVNITPKAQSDPQSPTVDPSRPPASLESPARSDES